MKSNSPHEWTVEQDAEGFFLADEYGEEILPLWLTMHRNPVSGEHTQWRCQTKKLADAVLADVVKYALDNWEPRETGDAWSGGFADNH